MSVSDLTPITKVRASDQIAHTLRRVILGGAYAIGERLPPERELAQTFGVTRGTVREALGRLEAQHLITIRQGDGARVLDALERGGLDMLLHLIFTDEGLDLAVLADVLEARQLFGVTAATWAARKRGGDVREQLATLHEVLTTRAVTGTALQQLDFDFLYGLARASGNTVLVLVMNTIRPLWQDNAELFATVVSDDEATRRDIAAVLSAVLHGQPEAAGQAMQRHLTRGGQTLLDQATQAAALLVGPPTTKEEE